uniref:Carboxylic ester hydrolase n=1 Tax=Bathyctena chuni TaxID=1403704 RepID=V9PPI5_BATCU|nr:carboxylesterase domain-containing protein [Bathyctena chuni]AHA51238.1 carboxylesterase domain-containing protein [Bathyctena chuni]
MKMNFGLFATSLLLNFINCENFLVTLDCGTVNGTKTTTDYGDVLEFIQMPYGIPPVGDRRWTHSELLDPIVSNGPCWDENVYDASSLRTTPIKCSQYSYYTCVGQEDCLHLSVRTPKLSGNYPVLVWLHGGSLMLGWSDEEGYSPTAEFTADLNVVTVNINYRLDIMGFFSTPEIWDDTENEGNYGNFGIGDAITALKWVKANIAKFGGNPESITLLGESSGANLVLGLLIADQADGLFHRAIALSASPKWKSDYEDAYKLRSSFTKDVGCTQVTISERRACLKSMDVETLCSKTDHNRGYGFYDFPYGDGLKGESMDYTIIEPTLIPYPPQDLKHESKTRNKRQKVKLILSNTAQENGYNALQYSLNQVYNWDQADELLTERIQNFTQGAQRKKLKSDFQKDIEELYNFGEDSSEWWPQIFWDTLTTDVRATCLLSDLASDLNKKQTL